MRFMEKVALALWPLVLLKTSVAIEITEVSQSPMIVHEGGTLELTCTSDQPWQFCSWEQTSNPDGRRFITIPQENLGTTEEGAKFFIDRHTCGLKIASAVDSDAGEWKCNLAKPGEDENHKAESIIEVLIVQEAELSFDPPTEEDIVLGDTVSMSCSVADPDIFPAPTLSIQMILPDGETTEEVASAMGEPSVDYTRTVTAEDEGIQFQCLSVQDSAENEVHIQKGPLDAPNPIHVVFPPMDTETEVDEQSSYIFQGDVLEIKFSFTARPEPIAEEGIKWLIVQDGVNDTLTEDTLLPGESKGDGFTATEIQSTDEPDKYWVALYVEHLTSNCSIELTITNPYGSLSKAFDVVYFSLEADDEEEDLVVPQNGSGNDTMEEDYERVTKASSKSGVIIAIIVVAVVLVVTLIVVVIWCICKKKREGEANINKAEKGEKEEKTALTKNRDEDDSVELKAKTFKDEPKVLKANEQGKPTVTDERLEGNPTKSTFGNPQGSDTVDGKKKQDANKNKQSGARKEVVKEDHLPEPERPVQKAPRSPAGPANGPSPSPIQRRDDQQQQHQNARIRLSGPTGYPVFTKNFSGPESVPTNEGRGGARFTHMSYIKPDKSF